MGNEKTVPATKYRKDIEQVRKEGFDEGLAQGRQEILDYLERAYLEDPGRPARGTPKAEAMLEIAHEAAAHFRKLAKKGRRK